MKKETKEPKETKKIKAEVIAPETVVGEDKTLDNDGRVGTMLKETRHKKGEEVEAISKTLRIRKSFLEAIEDSNYDEIPAAPYGQGFVRAYADYLGLNPVRMAQLFKEETDANTKKTDFFVIEPQAEATVPNRKYIVISIISILLVYAAWNLYSENVTETAAEAVIENVSPANDYPLQVEDFGEGSVTDEALAPTPSQTEVGTLPVIEANSVSDKSTPQIVIKNDSFPEASAPVVTPNPTPASTITVAEKAVKVVAESAPQAITTDAKVVIKVKKETWLEVKTKDKLYLSKVVAPGFSYNVPEVPGVVASVGRFDAVDTYVNGKLTPVFTATKKMGVEIDSLTNTNH